MPVNAVTLSIGHELTVGHTVDTNAAWLARRLAEIGVPVVMHVTAPDDLPTMVREIRRAAELADAVILSGGLGPTADDLTREALADVLGVALEVRPEWVERIRAFFTSRRRTMPEANVVQARFPVGTEPIENTCGTAPGIRATVGRATVFAMPGVPREMEVMFDRDVRPHLAARAGGDVLLCHMLHCYGAGESEIGERISDLMQRGRNPSVGTNVQQTIISIRVLAHSSDRAAAERMLDETRVELRRRLGPLVFGENDETLASAVAALLKSRGRTVTTAESCTGGLLAKCLTDVPGSSAYFIDGVISYANAAKTRLLDVPADLIERHGAVSAAVAEAMARGALGRSGTDYALSITGVAGPDGGTTEKPVGLVYVGLADRGACEVTEHRLGEFLTRMEIRERTCKIALNRLRLALISQQPFSVRGKP